MGPRRKRAKENDVGHSISIGSGNAAMAMPTPIGYRSVEAFDLTDVEAIWNTLRGGSVIDWKRLYLDDRDAAEEFLRSQAFRPELATDRARLDHIRRDAIDYLRRTFDYPIPGGVETLDVEGLLHQASGKGHRQLCACVILKVMHIIHHLQGRELLFMLPLSTAQVFQLVEEKVFGVVGEMMAARLPIAEFQGGRKHRDSIYTKLLSKSETIAAQIFDKLRFRIVTRELDDVLPVLDYLSRRLFPFNYVVPGESKNTLINPKVVSKRYPRLAELLQHPLGHPRDDATASVVDNTFSARSYRVVHWVVDLPVRLPDEVLARAPETARSLGPVVFVLAEFQLVDQQTALANESGEASHAEYKERQRQAVRKRLSLGHTAPKRSLRPPSEPPRPSSRPKKRTV